jgi:hypothetical protein
VGREEQRMKRMPCRLEGKRVKGALAKTRTMCSVTQPEQEETYGAGTGANESGKRGSGWQEMEVTHLFDACVSWVVYGATVVMINVEYRGVILRWSQTGIFEQVAFEFIWSVFALLAAVKPVPIARCSVDEPVCLPSGAVYGFTLLFFFALSALELAVCARRHIHKLTHAASCWTCARAAT